MKSLGDFGVIKYSLVGENSNYFEIDTNTGEILVANDKVLDRETLSEIVLTAVATDQGTPEDSRRSTTANVFIKIMDINDNAPAFRQRIYYANVAENAALHPPATILQVSAEDLDEDEAGSVKYSILSGNIDNAFKLDANSGILYPGISLVGRAGTYTIKIEARDGLGSGPHSDTADVIINVLEINQHRPVFIMPALSNATVEIVEVTFLIDKLKIK